MHDDALSGLQAIVENRIAEAIARGEFDHLPGAGKPLQLDDDLLVPAELRAAYRILKNAGYVPPEIEKLSEINSLLSMLERESLDADHAAASRRLRGLLIELELQGKSATARAAWQQYGEALARRLEKR
ncbi:MAG TPA: DnaJ family domain-containing protein [Burkholderiaceae bacterium]|nr:DnaJ family domain-containing protein [Burkholderiaceae bacterium]